MSDTVWLGRGRSLTGGPSRKHLTALARHSTPHKLLNLAWCELEYRLRIERVRAKPYILKMDLASACNLRCPGCPTGLRLPGRKPDLTGEALVDRVLSEVGDYLYIAHLYNWGEPLLNPAAPAIVARFSARNVFTSISSNLSLRDFDRLEDVCRAGLSHLIVSIDGISPSSYGGYRIRGNLDLVLDNLRRLVALKRADRSIGTIIEWQMLSLRCSEHELAEAFVLAREIGVDWFRTRAPIAPESAQPLAAERQGRHYGAGRACGSPWRYLAVQPDGAVSACCNTYFPEDDFGHLASSSINQVRNGERFVQARRLASKRRWRDHPVSPEHPCLRCPAAHASPHGAALRAAFPDARTDPGFMAVLKSGMTVPGWNVPSASSPDGEREV